MSIPEQPSHSSAGAERTAIRFVLDGEGAYTAVEGERAVMRRGDFTFRSMSDDGRFVFNRLEKYDFGIISPAYGVFYADGVSPEFLAHYLNSSYFAQLLTRETQGGTRKALRFSALAGMEVDLPKRVDQERIAAILDESRREIDLLQTQLEMFRRQKRGLMQKLLTGEWRVPVAEEAVA